MPESLGARLRQLRESQNLTREQLYSRTKILVSHIEALENGRWDLLPGQVYVKPFVKSLAEALGADYRELYALIDKQQTRTVAPLTPPKRGFDYRWLSVAAMSAVAVLVILLMGIYAQNRNGSRLDLLPKATLPAQGFPYSSHYSERIDFLPSQLPIEECRCLEMIALDSVTVVLLAGADTLFAGTLSPGQTMRHRSAQKFAIEMSRSHSLDILLDGQRVEQRLSVKGNRYLLLPGAPGSQQALSRGHGASQ